MTAGRLARFALRRALQAVPVVVGVVTLAFVLIHLAPGDPVYMMAGEGGDAEYYADMRTRYGLDRPLPAQFTQYLWSVAHGDFGYSYGYQEPVMTVVVDRLPVTLLLSGSALALAVVAGFGVGLVAALAPRSKADLVLRVITSVVFAAPVFWIGQLLLIGFAVTLPLFPVGGLSSLRGDGPGPVVDLLWHMALPAACLSTGMLALLGRVLRAGVLEEISREYVRAAIARGGSRTRAVLTHALPNALLPAVTVIGHHAGHLLTGAVLTEVVFGWPGIGRLLIDASTQRDYPLVIAVLFAVSIVVILANLITDVTYVVIDPRIEG